MPHVGWAASTASWTREMKKPFLVAKVALAEATHLVHPVSWTELALAVDANNHHRGVALQQRAPGTEWQPLPFFSRKPGL